jgi:hypothetical protein
MRVLREEEPPGSFDMKLLRITEALCFDYEAFARVRDATKVFVGNIKT